MQADTSNVMTRPQVWLIDPDGFTPLYDVNLAANLEKLGYTVHFAASSLLNRKLQSPDCSIKLTFAFFGILTRFRLMGHATQARAILLRRMAKAWVYPFDIVRLSLRLLRERPGIAHVQWALLPVIDMFFWYVWRRCGWVVIHTIHDPIQLEGSPLGPLVALQGKLCMAADRVIVHDRVAAIALSNRGVPRERIQIIQPGPPVKYAAVERGVAREELKLAPEGPILLFFGFLKKYKGLQTLLQSMPAVMKAFGQVSLLIAGECQEPREPYLKLISRLDLEEAVRWDAGYVPDERTPFYFAAADAVVLPYTKASSSGVLLSAYAYKRPVVASAVGGIPELVEDGLSGFLVPPADPRALADAVCRLLRDPSLAANMGRRGQSMLTKRFDWLEIAGCASVLYQSLWEKEHGEG